MTSGLPLAGLRVLDFAWIGAGALVTKGLAELGAEILRVESNARPDNLRQSPPVRPGTSGLEASGYFASRNPNKKSIALNMKHPRSRKVALDLAARSDVLTSNFRVGVLDRWGLGYHVVSEVNPRLVYVVMPMQGLNGPHRDYVGFGSTIAALGGLVASSGAPGRAPVGTGTHYPDHVPNPGHALVATLAAIYHQRRTGEGQLVELSQLESTVNIVGPGVLHSSLGGSAAPAGNRSAGAAPRGIYRCTDSDWIAIACSSELEWHSLARAVDREKWLADERFTTAIDRRRNADDLDIELTEAIESWTRAVLLDTLASADVPSAPVNSPRDVIDDPHLAARGFWQSVEHPVIGELPMFHVPFRMDGNDRPKLSRPPLLGEHTREVITELLGMADHEYDELVADGVFL